MNKARIQKIAKNITALQFDTKQQLFEYKKTHESRPTTKLTVKPQKQKSTHQVEIQRKNEEIIRNLFTDQEKRQEKANNNRFRDNYWEKAEETQKLMQSTLDEGKEKQWLGSNASICSFEQSEIKKPGAKLLIAPMKRKARAEEKIREYGGNIGELTDAVRCSVVVDRMQDLPHVLKNMKKKGIKIVSPPKNRFEKRLKSGYGDILLNVDFGNGFVSQMQLHTKNMLCAKQFHGGHKLYESEREIYTHYPRKTQPEDMREQDRIKLQKLLKRQRRLYDKAYQQDIRKAKEVDILNNKDMEFYLYGEKDFLAFKLKNKFPMYYVNHKWKKIYSYLEFADNAVEISQKEFINRAKKLGIKFDI